MEIVLNGIAQSGLYIPFCRLQVGAMHDSRLSEGKRNGNLHWYYCILLLPKQIPSSKGLPNQIRLSIHQLPLRISFQLNA